MNPNPLLDPLLHLAITDRLRELSESAAAARRTLSISQRLRTPRLTWKGLAGPGRPRESARPRCPLAWVRPSGVRP